MYAPSFNRTYVYRVMANVKIFQGHRATVHERRGERRAAGEYIVRSERYKCRTPSIYGCGNMVLLVSAALRFGHFLIPPTGFLLRRHMLFIYMFIFYNKTWDIPIGLYVYASVGDDSINV